MPRAPPASGCSISTCARPRPRRSRCTRRAVSCAGAPIRATRWSTAAISRAIFTPWSFDHDAPRRSPMILFPAIDLKDGKCVRLLRGEMAQVTVFNADPAAQARAFADKGCEWLHVVDLDGAITG